MQELFTTILSQFNTDNIGQRFSEGLPFLTAGFVFILGIYFFAPKLSYWLGLVQQKRKFWKYQALVGKKMSKRAKDLKIAKRSYDMLLDAVKAGEITHKDKRYYLRILETAFDLEPGVLRPHPSVPETKRRIRSRLSAKSAEASTVSPIRRLATLMKG